MFVFSLLQIYIILQFSVISFPSLLKYTIENLAENNLTVEELLADGGYSSGEALQVLEDNNKEGYIPNFGQYKSDREAASFVYNEVNDKYICSQGKELPFKKIGHTIHKPLYDLIHAKQQTQKAKRMKKLPSSTVEPVLGTLVNYLGMRRLNTQGIAQANKCMLMAAIAYNLKKLLKFTTRKVQTNAGVVQVNTEKTVQALQDLFLRKIRLIKPTYLLLAPLY